MKSKSAIRIGALLGCLCGLALTGLGTAYAKIVPGVDEPYDPGAYYSNTAISWADSAPSVFAWRELTGGMTASLRSWATNTVISSVMDSIKNGTTPEGATDGFISKRDEAQIAIKQAEMEKGRKLKESEKEEIIKKIARRGDAWDLVTIAGGIFGGASGNIDIPSEVAGGGTPVFDYTRLLKEIGVDENVQKLFELLGIKTGLDIKNLDKLPTSVMNTANSDLKNMEKITKSVSSKGDPLDKKIFNSTPVDEGKNFVAVDKATQYKWLQEQYAEIAENVKKGTDDLQEQYKLLQDALEASAKAESEVAAWQANAQVAAIRSEMEVRQAAIRSELMKLRAIKGMKEHSDYIENKMVISSIESGQGIIDPYDEEMKDVLKKTLNYEREATPPMPDFE